LPVDPTPYALGKKSIPGLPVWLELKTDYLVLVTPLDMDGVTVEGLRLRVTARKSLPDEQVTLQMEYRNPAGEGGPFARIEWRPLRPHDNKGFGPPEWRHRKMYGTHHHSFAENWLWCQQQVERGRLKVALPIDPDAPSFTALLAVAAQEFRIPDLTSIAAPGWEANLL
jgi:hypothetical protein